MYVCMYVCKCLQYFILVAPKQSHPSSHNLEDQQGHPHQFHHNLKDQQSDPHQFTYNPEDRSTGDATGRQYCVAAYKV